MLFTFNRFDLNVHGALNFSPRNRVLNNCRNVITDQINPVKLHANVYACIRN